MERRKTENEPKRRVEVLQTSYSAKFLQALRLVRKSSFPAPTPSRDIQGAANWVSAALARGRTRWSQAILSSRRMPNINKKKKKKKKVMVTGNIRLRKGAGGFSRLPENRVPALERRVRILGRLIPGCQKLPLPDLLEETTDYIAALEMQVRAMTALTNMLSPSLPGSPANMG